ITRPESLRGPREFSGGAKATMSILRTIQSYHEGHEEHEVSNFKLFKPFVSFVRFVVNNQSTLVAALPHWDLPGKNCFWCCGCGPAAPRLFRLTEANARD
ncbi:MAG: hypothetical protein ACREQ7_06965, partial [Candidatus Binatia bacterium]